MTTYPSTTSHGACVFCEIAHGTLKTPGIFWEDDAHMAFLSIDPNTEGFSCVIPKEHHGSDIMKMPDDALQQLIIASKKISHILESYFEDVGRIGVMMEGTGIDHAHVKLFPMHGTQYLKDGNWKQVLSGKEFWFDTYEGWICSGGGPKTDPEELRKLAKGLRNI